MSRTQIGKGTRIEGLVKSRGELWIHGRVEGQVEARRLMVAEGARVEADLRAETVHVHGDVRGHILASDLAELHTGAEMNGNIQAGRILIADGAKFKGNVDMEGIRARDDESDD